MVGCDHSSVMDNERGKVTFHTLSNYQAQRANATVNQRVGGVFGRGSMSSSKTRAVESWVEAIQAKAQLFAQMHGVLGRF